MKDQLILVGAALVALVVGTILFLFGSLAHDQDKPQTELAAVSVPFAQLVQGDRSTVTTRVNYLITSPSELTTLWKMIDATGTPPTVDFASHAVVAVFAGQASTTGSRIHISDIEDVGSRVVSVMLTKPGSGCVVKQVPSAPYEVVVMPTTILPLAHQDEMKVVECPR